MSNETTTTTLTSKIRSEEIAAAVVPAHTPNVVATNLVNYGSLLGVGADAHQTPVDSDLGAASGGTEGTAITANTAMTMGSAIAVTPTEGALVRSTITYDAIERAHPELAGMELDGIVHELSSEQLLALILPYAQRLSLMMREKLEDDLLNLTTSASNTVGTSGVDLSASTLIAAMYQHDVQNPKTSARALLMFPNQVRELREQLLSTGGGLGGSAWSQQADASFLNDRGEGGLNGLVGSALGIPVFQAAHDLRTISGGDVVGALLSIASTEQGRDLDGPAPEIGAWGMVERGGHRYGVDGDVAERAIIVVARHVYAVAEYDDGGIVGIVSDAP